jgi:hypothetical protein
MQDQLVPNTLTDSVNGTPVTRSPIGTAARVTSMDQRGQPPVIQHRVAAERIWALGLQVCYDLLLSLCLARFDSKEQAEEQPVLLDVSKRLVYLSHKILSVHILLASLSVQFCAPCQLSVS